MKSIDPYKKSPNRIGELIYLSKKTLKQISEETGIAYPTLSGYNQGVRNPKKNNAKILADYFGVSIPYLLGFETKIPINTNTEIFKQLKSINQLKSQLLSELLDLDNQEKELFSKLNE